MRIASTLLLVLGLVLPMGCDRSDKPESRPQRESNAKPIPKHIKRSLYEVSKVLLLLEIGRARKSGKTYEQISPTMPAMTAKACQDVDTYFGVPDGTVESIHKQAVSESWELSPAHLVGISMTISEKGNWTVAEVANALSVTREDVAKALSGSESVASDEPAYLDGATFQRLREKNSPVLELEDSYLLERRKLSEQQLATLLKDLRSDPERRYATATILRAAKPSHEKVIDGLLPLSEDGEPEVRGFVMYLFGGIADDCSCWRLPMHHIEKVKVVLTGALKDRAGFTYGDTAVFDTVAGAAESALSHVSGAEREAAPLDNKRKAPDVQIARPPVLTPELWQAIEKYLAVPELGDPKEAELTEAQKKILDDGYVIAQEYALDHPDDPWGQYVTAYGQAILFMDPGEKMRASLQKLPQQQREIRIRLLNAKKQGIGGAGEYFRALGEMWRDFGQWSKAREAPRQSKEMPQ